MSAMEAQRAPSPTIQDIENKMNARREGGGVFAANQRETGQYIADMILELRNMAKAAKLFKVMVPLEFAYYEAFAVANKVEIPPEELQRLHDLSRQAKSYEPAAEE
jgi:hypothetical protein